MIDVCLLGTGGMMPLTYRYLTSLYIRGNGTNVLIDCGEATQLAISKAELSTKPIDLILITHFHADHISGLPGLLLSQKNSDRTEPVTIAGPKDLKHVVDSLRVIATDLPFKINYIELLDEHGVFNFKDLKIEYFTLKHKILCIGYNIYVNRLPIFDVEKAKMNNIPLKYWNNLQHGKICEDKDNNKVYTPDMCMGEDRKGLKLTYLTDTRPCENIYKYACDSDLFICEGMYGDDEKSDNAKKYMHTTMKEACEIASMTNPKEMWLTHFSPSENNPKIYQNMVSGINDKVIIAKDNFKKVLNFEN